MGLLVLLALVIGLAIGSFALGNPEVRTTPGPTTTVTATATVTPPAQTVTAPPATVTVTSAPAGTSTASAPDTTAIAVAGQSCSTFGDVAYSASGARLTCTRPTVQDYLRWMQLG